MRTGFKQLVFILSKGRCLLVDMVDGGTMSKVFLKYFSSMENQNENQNKILPSQILS